MKEFKPRKEKECNRGNLVMRMNYTHTNRLRSQGEMSVYSLKIKFSNRDTWSVSEIYVALILKIRFPLMKNIPKLEGNYAYRIELGRKQYQLEQMSVCK